MVQYSRATNAAISSSRSQIMRSAGLCTRPADRPGADLFPQQRREIEPHQEIERPPRLLRVHQIDRQLARLRHRLAHRVLGDLVEHDPLHLLALQRPLRLQQFVQVPGYGFALAVRVGREIQRLWLFSAPARWRRRAFDCARRPGTSSRNDASDRRRPPSAPSPERDRRRRAPRNPCRGTS